MLKHLPPTAGDLLKRYIGPYQASLAWKKSRLLIATTSEAPAPEIPDLVTRYELADTSFLLANRPGGFSRERLDIGTRVLLPCIPVGVKAARIVDLGCGIGARGIQAASNKPAAQLRFFDEPNAAVAAARDNFAAAFPGRQAQFRVADGPLDAVPGPAELELCNPPFH